MHDNRIIHKDLKGIQGIIDRSIRLQYSSQQLRTSEDLRFRMQQLNRTYLDSQFVRQTRIRSLRQYSMDGT